MARKLKTPRRKSVTKPTRRYDVSGRAVGSSVATRRTTKTPKPVSRAAVSKKRSYVKGRYDTVTSKSGKTYKRLKPEFRAEPSTNGRRKTEISPRNIYVKGKSAAIAGTGTQRVTADRGGGRADTRTAAQKSGMGYGESAYKRMPSIRKATTLSGGITTGGPVKQSTQAEIKSMQRQMDAERNMNRAKAETSSFERRFEALKRKLRGVQGNPGRGGFGTGKKY